MRRKWINDRQFFRSLDWRLLLFLVLFLDVRLVCKLAAVVLIYILRPDFRFGMSLKSSRLPLFYIGMIGIALLDWILYGLYANGNYTISLICGLLSWSLCLLAIHQVKLSVERSDAAVLHRTLLVFFSINALISVLMLVGIMIATGALNPYTYQGDFQEYFLGTGDYIRGLSFDVSSTNAYINAFGVLYFLYRKQAGMVLVCMIVMLLTASNATTLLLLLALIWPFFFRSSRDRKSLIILCFFLVILFTVKISPENGIYVVYSTEKIMKGEKMNDPAVNPKPVAKITDMPDSLLDPEQKKLKIATAYLDSVTYLLWLYKDSMYRLKGDHTATVRPLPHPNIFKQPEYQLREDTSLMRKRLNQFIQDEELGAQVDAAGEGCCKIPGKLISMMQTEKFMAAHPGKLITGDGLGRFSSKQAFRSTALGFAGKYPARFQYINKDFRDWHLPLYLFYFAKGLELRSMTNSPECVYDQLLGEYGLVGLVLFGIFYIGFFARHFRKLSYGLPLLFVMLAGFFTGYWFEQLSIVVLFECLLLIDIKEGVGS